VYNIKAMDKELIADMRNKLTLPKTVLECLKDGKEVPKETIKLALKELDEAVELLKGE